MRIAIIGSWDKVSDFDLPLKSTNNEFYIACRQIGYEIALQGHVILGSSYNPTAAEYHAIQGALEAVAKSNSKRIVAELLRSSGYPSVSLQAFEHDIERFPQNLAFSHLSANSASLAHLYSVKHAHQVIIIGGKSGSYNAGIATLVAGKRLVPVGSFGGAAEKLLGTTLGLQSTISSYALDSTKLGQLRNPWSDEQLHFVISALGFKDFPRIIVVHGRSTDFRNLVEHLVNTLHVPTPIIMKDVFGNGRAISSKLQELALSADGAIILATSDDIGAANLRADGNTIPKDLIQFNNRARQNVWLEAGMLWGAIGLERILILRRGDIEIPSDILGIEDYEYIASPVECGKAIGEFIEIIRNK